jgi:hypothetical protein
MKNTILNLFIMLGFFFGITSCSEKNEHPKPNERTLPEITFEGKQILACRSTVNCSSLNLMSNGWWRVTNPSRYCSMTRFYSSEVETRQ